MQPDMPSNTTIRFHRVYPAALSPMRADTSALGLLPVMAYRHCEPMRMASAFGWYAFAAESVELRWNGSDVFVKADGLWQPLEYLELPGFKDYWNQRVPSDLVDLVPPFLSRLPVPGLVQIWTGLLCSADAGWSVLVRSPSNIRGSFLYATHEGIIEADRYRLFPLFMNIQLLATDVEISVHKTMPLLQVQPLLRRTYGDQAHSSMEVVGLDVQPDGTPALSKDEWQAYRQTIRVEAIGVPPTPGKYAAETRRRNKHGH